MARGTQVARRLVLRGLSRELRQLLRDLDYADEGHGYDRFGLHPDGVALGLALTRFLYERWFRVTTHGAEHLAGARPAVLACNHSGTLPFDAMMVWADILRHTSPPWAPRVVMDHFVNQLPFVGTLFDRAGAVGGSRGNFGALLGRGESVLVFPEGVPGIAKPFRERYQLAPWRHGHAELAIRHGVPVVPVAVIGAEEQMPQLAKIERFKAFGAPHLPIPLTLLPLPVHYHIWYGAPLPLHERFAPDQANDPDAVAEAAGEVRRAVQALIAQGLSARPGVFR